MNEAGLDVLSVRDLVTDGRRYRIPIYQRAFAWGKDEIEALLDDVRDYRRLHPDGRYFIGTLVVHALRLPELDGVTYEVVDGQQRLTALCLIFSHPRVRGMLGDVVAPGLLTFEGRSRSTSDLRELQSAAIGDQAPELDDAGMDEAVKVIGAKLQGGVPPEDFEYLLDHVQVVRSELPSGTDLNHYFEIMNSRGEQLEKHEIVKGRLLTDGAGQRRQWVSHSRFDVAHCG